ncbi:N-acetyltransferase [Maioricimonas sp. JC845]|uniref:GNAT family N-acetyltransferase n=1 Tax=Maioricimonas sp. JC845 TaxID=3232138 RepID=UPI003458399F
MTLTIRPETSQDRAAVRHVNEAAFQSTAEPELVEDLHESGDVVCALVAEVDGQVVGHILFSRQAIETTTGESRPAVSLAPMAVLPEFQKQGIGSRLVREGLAACRNAGERIVTVLGHPAYYPRFGFAAELARRLDSPFDGGDAWMALELVPGTLDDVAGTVRFAEPFNKFA